MRSVAIMAIVVAGWLSPAATHANDAVAPVPPCAGTAHPAPAPLGAVLNMRVWMEDEVPAGWAPANCTGWEPGPTKVLLAAAGRFQFAGGGHALAARLGEFSKLTSVIYWSNSRKVWRPLFADASALSGPDRAARRKDFSPGELNTGVTLHYWQEEDNLMRGVVFRVHIRALTPDRFDVEIINVSPLGFAIFNAADPGEFRQLYFMEREKGDIWRYYSLVRMGDASTLAATSAATYRNRAAAFFRYLAGLKMDREPPAAR